jgi:SAM-dependent methyltransferase
MTTDTRQLYERYHRECPFPAFGQDTFQGENAVAAYRDAATTLDFGCGNGFAVRKMREAGYDWYGLEYSEAAYEQYLDPSCFFLGDTRQFADSQFDMAYSTEVLEHIPAELVGDIIADLCRVTRRYIFLTISLRPSSDNNKYHCTLRPRVWWEQQFTNCGFEVDRPVVERFQRLSLKSTSQILAKWSHLGPECRKFAENPPYELYGESQFWYFAFRREGVPPPPLPRAKQSPLKKALIRGLRWCWRLDGPGE